MVYMSNWVCLYERVQGEANVLNTEIEKNRKDLVIDSNQCSASVVAKTKLFYAVADSGTH